MNLKNILKKMLLTEASVHGKVVNIKAVFDDEIEAKVFRECWLACHTKEEEEKLKRMKKPKQLMCPECSCIVTPKDKKCPRCGFCLTCSDGVCEI